MLYQHIEIRCNYSGTDISAPASADDRYPVLQTYMLENSAEIEPVRTRPCVIICPGGGYRMTSEREGEHIALRLNALGFSACILTYSVAPAVFPIALTELAASVALVRSNADKWHIDPGRICVMGFSAGGHLAASLGVFWNQPLLAGLIAGGVIPGVTQAEQIRPNAQLLCYPVITSGEFAHRDSFRALLGSAYEQLVDTVSLENQITPSAPPAFIWHTYEDDAVPVENSLLFAAALRRNHIPFELHIYQKGGHGLSAANSETGAPGSASIQVQCQNWLDMAAVWIHSHGRKQRENAADGGRRSSCESRFALL